MKKVWVVVANQCEMKIYRAENNNTLIEQNTLMHEEGHKAVHDLVSDRQGSCRSGFGSDTLGERTPTKVKEADHFAHQIAHLLEVGLNAHEFEHLYVIAKPPFLSTLTLAMKSHVAKSISGEIHKDIVHATKEEIRSYLPPTL